MEQNQSNKIVRNSGEFAAKARYSFFITENEIYIIDKTNDSFALKINRKEYHSSFIPKNQLGNLKVEKPLHIYAIFGVIEISDIRFLVAVSRAQIIGSIGGSDIMKIDSIKFLTISREQYVNFDYESCYDKLERIKEFLKIGFYFSYSYKLHFQFNGKTLFTPNELTSDFNKSHFIWNYKSIKPFLKSYPSNKPSSENKADLEVFDFLGLQPDIPDQIPENFATQFFVPFIQGYVAFIEEKDFKFVLISRRSYLMGGTRYNNRGIDNNGHVANYVETEQLMFNKDKIYRFFQIRGSLPFYWEQVKGLLNPTVEIHQRLDINLEVAARHIALATVQKFKKIIFFNLLSKKKTDEEVLSNYLVQLLDSLSKQAQFKGKIAYEHVDFHAITKPTDYSAVDKFIYNMFNTGFNNSEVGFDEFEYSELLESFVLKNQQQALLRTNCLDCLDRTNATQTKIGHYVLYKMLEKSGVSLFKLFSPEDRKNPLPFFEKGGNAFFEELRRIWANNGDTISLIYAGTGATTSSVTRKGEKSTLTSFLDHKLKTVRRFYLNTFDDNFKQEIIDILLHKKTQSIRQSTLFQKDNDLPQIEELTLHLISFLSVPNNGNLVLSKNTLLEIFDQRTSKDLILVIARNDKERNVSLGSENYIVCNSFLELFQITMKSNNDFKLIEEYSDSKFQLMLFAHKEHISRISYSKSDKISLGNLFQTLGFRSSFIIDRSGVEIFCIKLENSAFNYSPAKAIEKIFDKYIDKEYDLVVFIAQIENYQPEKIVLSKKYFKICEETIKDQITGKYFNTIVAFGSKDLMGQGFTPEFKPVIFENEQNSKELIFNALTFQIKKVN